MRPIRTLPILAGLTALVVAAAVAFACNGSETKVTGTFDATGHFVLSGAWDQNGAPIENAKGMVLQSFTTADNVVIAASNLSGKQVCLFGDLDAANQTMHVAGFKDCSAGACGAKGASAQTAGASCCPSKASAATAGAGASCASKADAATANAPAACASKASAATAGAGAGCCAKDAAAKTAAAGSSCTGGTDAAAAKANKMASAAPKADAAAASIVYSVSGMTCGGCASKVKSAVASIANVSGCTVDVAKGQAVVTTTGDVDREAIQKAITAAGFPAQPAATESATG